MEQKLLSITDDNSILITAEFHRYGEIVKVGESYIQSYEIDIIVRNDMTCDQLLESIRDGLKNKLKLYGCSNPEEEIPYMADVLYMDERHPESESEEVAQPSSRKGLLPSIHFGGILKKNNTEKEESKSKADNKDKKESRSTTENKEEKESEEESEEAKKTFEEIEKEGYIVCWQVFLKCYKEYLEPSDNNLTEIEKIKNGTPRKAVIGLASINYNNIPENNDGTDTKLTESDRNQICLILENRWGSKRLKDTGFITTTRIVFDPFGWHHSAALYNRAVVVEAFKDKVPLYNISERPLLVLDDEPVHIIAPSDPPQKNRQNIIMTLMTPLLTMGAMIAVRSFSGYSSGSGSLILMSICMGSVSLLTGILHYVFQKRDYAENVSEWREHYQSYIARLLDDIVEKQTRDAQTLKELYPPARRKTENIDLIQKAQEVNGDIFSRDLGHPDFLKVRIGLSTKESQLVPSVFKIEGDKQETIFASATYHNIKNVPGYDFGIFLRGEDEGKSDSRGLLVDLPMDISKEYAFLADAPVMLNIKECGTLGIIFDKEYKSFQPFLSNLILDLCFYHSPDSLQCVMFCEENSDWIERQKIIRRFKYLPHFRELLGNLSPFAFNKSDAYKIFNKLLEIVSARRDIAEGEVVRPHILVIVLEEYELKKHAISEYLPSLMMGKEAEKHGISFVFCKRFAEELPGYCGRVIRRKCVDHDYRDEYGELLSEWYLQPHEQLITRKDDLNETSLFRRYRFKPDSPPPAFKDLGNEDNNDQYIRAFKSISSLYYERIAQGSDVPSSLELFDILGDSKADEIDGIKNDIHNFIAEQWGKGDITKSLAVPIGKKSNDEGSKPVMLDLHEKADGPHMLVAGTTGSGKTETILTFLIGLCAMYSPEEVNLLLMDMKGAGFVQRIGDSSSGRCLPHIVGTVTDISGDESGTGMLYMLRRFLQSMHAEVKRRKIYLNKMLTDSVDGYISARKNLDDHLRKHPELLKKYKREDIERMPPMPHLFLVIDEFTELMRISGDDSDTDFKSEITSLARIGRSLGFHIILISQNIENAITPDIRVNSRARLCLKVATRDASKEMIGTDLAANPLMPGNGRAYLLVGTGSRFEYFQSAYSGADIRRDLEKPIVITQAETSGEYSLFFDSKSSFEKEKKAAASPDDLSFASLEEDENDMSKENETLSEEEDKSDFSENIEETLTSDDQKSNEDALSIVMQEISKEEREHVKYSMEECDEEPVSMTQVEFFVKEINAYFDELLKENGIERPHCVFQQPLPTACYYDFDKKECETIEDHSD